VIRSLRATLRLRYENREVIDRLLAADRRYVHAFWHSRLLIMPYSYFGPRISILISRHRDGELIARTMARFGHATTRGSSSRGGAAALREAVRLVREGWDIGITPDGPRGPARVAQPGVVQVARLTGAPVVPVTVAASRGKRLSSWDSFLVPRPFSRVLIAYGEPLVIPRKLDEGEFEAWRLRVEGALNELTDRADREMGDGD
jgi:lysophospholipid acyltransferase (LPLAT)-like uncharacterized protein